MRGTRSLPIVVAVLLCGAVRAASAACIAQPTPACLLADAQVAAMAMMDTRSALADFAFTGWVQAAVGDGAGARDTLRVAELRALGAAPAGLANYHAGVAGIWAVLDDAGRARAAVEAARTHMDAAEPYGRGIALADAAYALALLGDGAAAADTFRQALDGARGPDGDPFLLAYVGWNQVLVGERAAGLAAVQEALDRPAAEPTLTLWIVAYAAVSRSFAGDPAAAATRDRLRQAATDAAPDGGRTEGWMVLAWSFALGGERAQAEALVREHLPEAYNAADGNTKAIALTYAALALAPTARLGP